MTRRKGIQKNSGFTLIELLVTISIFVILTTIVLFSQKDFDNSILVGNVSYDIALTIKQAQNYGGGVRESPFLSAGTTNFTSSYGVYMTKGAKNFTLFSDTNPVNNDFDGTCAVGADECLTKYAINRGLSISKVCVGTAASCVEVTKLVILFSNQKLDAKIFGDGGATPQSYAKITVSSPKGATSSIIVSNIGQIYVSR